MITARWADGHCRYPTVEFRRIFRPLHRPVPPDAAMVTAYTDGRVTLRSNVRLDGYHEAADMSAMQGVAVGDFVVHGLDILRGSVGVSDSSGAISSVCTICEPVTSADPRYFAWVIRAQAKTGFQRALARGVREGGADFRRWDTLAELPVPAPPVSAQRAIADFLDRETGRVDGLIAAKRRMIELLEEKHSACLTLAISGGEHASLAATADEWFPDPPADWRLSSVGGVTHAILDGPHVSPQYVDREEGVPFISVRNISTLGWDMTTAKYISRSDYNHFCRRVKPELGDVLLTKGGNTGIAREVDLEFDFHVWVHVAILKVNREIIRPSFLEAVLNSRSGYEQSQLGTRGATNQDLVLGRIAKIRIPLPPLEEQDRIVSSIERATSPIKQTVANLRRQIELLVEHRHALITAAVTGEANILAVSA